MATRRELRRAIGQDLQGSPLDGGMRLIPASGFTATTLTSPGLVEPAPGSWLVIPRADASPGLVSVTKYDLSSGVLTFRPDLSDPPSAPVDVELWDQKYYPGQVEALINLAIDDAEAMGVYAHVTDPLVYLGPYARRISAPPDWEVLRSVECVAGNFGYGFGGDYVDLLQSLQASDDAVDDGSFFPFRTIRLSGAGSFVLDQTIPLGLYDSIGWEVAGNFDNEASDTGWRFVRHAFDPYTAPRDDDGKLVVSYDAGNVSYVTAAYIYQEAQVKWKALNFTVWEGSGEVEIDTAGTEGGIYSGWGTRLRLQGGEALSRLGAEDAEAQLPASYIRSHALVSLLRSVPDVVVGEDGTPIRREWVVKLQQEMSQLPRMHNVRYLK